MLMYGRKKKYRKAIIFHLALIIPDHQNSIKEPKTVYKTSHKGLKSRTLAELRDIALTVVSKSFNKKEIKTSVIIRSEAIKSYALKRANGDCEGCSQPAPFFSKGGPFLEVHHIERIADGGPDHPENVAALCPNCHKRAHFSLDGEEYNQRVRNKIKIVEEKST
jgi:5-methylcytosine-specific restriction enzyme A